MWLLHPRIRAGFEPFRAWPPARLSTSEHVDGEIGANDRRVAAFAARLKTGARSFIGLVTRRSRRVFRPPELLLSDPQHLSPVFLILAILDPFDLRSR